MTTDTQLLIIGAGPGGYVAAIRAAQLGLEVTLVERDALGGVCLNHGCIPSKALISAADLFHRLQTGHQRGIQVDGVHLKPAELQSWKQEVVDTLTGGVARLCRGHEIEVVKGTARFTSENTARVETPEGTRTFHFEQAVIATGSHPVELPGFPFDGKHILQSKEALQLESVPERLLVIGGGYIGLELGTAYQKLGSQVTVVEMEDQLLPGTDTALVRIVARRLKKLGIEVVLETRAHQWHEPNGSSGALTVDTENRQGDSQRFETDQILVTVGRRPNTQNLGLDSIGINVDERGFINVNDQQQTSVPQIYAIGDAAGQPMLAHKASAEGIVAAEVIAGQASATDFVSVPAVIFTDPEIATVGLTESEAVAQGYEVEVGRFPFAANGRALTTGNSDGFVQCVAEADSGLLLGVQMVGPEASNLISEAALALEMVTTVEDLARTVHAHPTLPESLKEAAEATMGQAIHILQKP